MNDKILFYANGNIKYLFIKHKFSSYSDFARKLEIDRTLPEKIINGKQYPSINTLISIRNYFNINLDDLVFKDLSKEQE